MIKSLDFLWLLYINLCFTWVSFTLGQALQMLNCSFHWLALRFPLSYPVWGEKWSKLLGSGAISCLKHQPQCSEQTDPRLGEGWAGAAYSNTTIPAATAFLRRAGPWQWLQRLLLSHGYFNQSLFPPPQPQSCPGDGSVSWGWMDTQTAGLQQALSVSSHRCCAPGEQCGVWMKGRVSLLVFTGRGARCSAKAVTRCQFIVPCAEALPGDEVQRKPEVAGALEGSKRSLVEGLGKSCLTNLFFYVWLLAGSPENSFLIISLTGK